MVTGKSTAPRPFAAPRGLSPIALGGNIWRRGFQPRIIQPTYNPNAAGSRVSKLTPSSLLPVPHSPIPGRLVDSRNRRHSTCAREEDARLRIPANHRNVRRHSLRARVPGRRSARRPRRRRRRHPRKVGPLPLDARLHGRGAIAIEMTGMIVSIRGDMFRNQGFILKV